VSADAAAERRRRGYPDLPRAVVYEMTSQRGKRELQRRAGCTAAASSVVQQVDLRAAALRPVNYDGAAPPSLLSLVASRRHFDAVIDAQFFNAVS